MKLTVAILLLATFCHAKEAKSSKSQQEEKGKSDKRELLEGNAGVEKGIFSTVSPGLIGIEYADTSESYPEKSPPQQHYGTPAPPLVKISDVLTSQEPPYQEAIASYLYSPVSVYQYRLATPTTYEVSAPIASQLAYAEHKVYQPQNSQYNEYNQKLDALKPNYPQLTQPAFNQKQTLVQTPNYQAQSQPNDQIYQNIPVYQRPSPNLPALYQNPQLSYSQNEVPQFVRYAEQQPQLTRTEHQPLPQLIRAEQVLLPPLVRTEQQNLPLLVKKEQQPLHQLIGTEQQTSPHLIRPVQQPSSDFIRPEQQTSPHLIRIEQQPSPHSFRPEQQTSPHLIRTEQLPPSHLIITEQQPSPHLIRTEQQTYPQLTRTKQHPLSHLIITEQQTLPHLIRKEQQTYPQLTRTEQQPSFHLTRTEQQTSPHLIRTEQQTPLQIFRTEQQLVPQLFRIEQQNLPQVVGSEQTGIVYANQGPQQGQSHHHSQDPIHQHQPQAKLKTHQPEPTKVPNTHDAAPHQNHNGQHQHQGAVSYAMFSQGQTSPTHQHVNHQSQFLQKFEPISVNSLFKQHTVQQSPQSYVHQGPLLPQYQSPQHQQYTPQSQGYFRSSYAPPYSLGVSTFPAVQYFGNYAQSIFKRH